GVVTELLVVDVASSVAAPVSDIPSVESLVWLLVLLVVGLVAPVAPGLPSSPQPNTSAVQSRVETKLIFFMGPRECAIWSCGRAAHMVRGAHMFGKVEG